MGVCGDLPHSIAPFGVLLLDVRFSQITRIEEYCRVEYEFFVHQIMPEGNMKG